MDVVTGGLFIGGLKPLGWAYVKRARIMYKHQNEMKLVGVFSVEWEAGIERCKAACSKKVVCECLMQSEPIEFFPRIRSAR